MAYYRDLERCTYFDHLEKRRSNGRGTSEPPSTTSRELLSTTTSLIATSPPTMTMTTS